MYLYIQEIYWYVHIVFIILALEMFPSTLNTNMS